MLELRAPAGRNSLDDQIRRQIAGALGGIPVGDRHTDVGEVSRHTAQATDPDGSGLLQKIDETGRATMLPQVDENGITMLVDETTIAAAPRAIGRVTGPNAAILEPSGPVTRTRTPPPSMPVKQRGLHTTPLPPSGDDDGADHAARFERAEYEPRRSRAWIPFVAVVAAGGVATGVWWARRTSDTPSAAPPIASAAATIDAAPAPSTGTLLVDSVPQGATATIDGHVIGKTPTEYPAPAGKALSVGITMPGYEPVVDYKVTLAAGARTIYSPSLVPARARLHVDSDPPGATVTLRGRALGDTPLDLDDLDALGKVELAVTLTGYERATAPVELRAGERALARVTLKALPKLGMITISFSAHSSVGWADVYLGSKKIGRAPAPHLRLPAGKQRLKLVNPYAKRTAWLNVDVSPTDEHTYKWPF